MKKKIFGVLLAGAMCLPLGLGLSGCCEQSEQNQGVKDIYAMSALSSVMYLNDETSLSGQNATARPDCFTESEVKSVRDYFEMFNGMLIDDGLKQDVRKTTAEDETYAEKYSYCMTITLPNLDGQKVEYKMYYDEFDLETEEEIGTASTKLKCRQRLMVLCFSMEKSLLCTANVSLKKRARKPNLRLSSKLMLLVAERTMLWWSKVWKTPNLSMNTRFIGVAMKSVKLR